MAFAEKHWGETNGIGLDISPSKVKSTREIGYQAEVVDLTKPLNFSGIVKFSILSHVLEHIPNAVLADQILKTAAVVSSEFFLVRQPWFDSDGALALMGLKLYWSDWPTGHTNPMTSLQLYSSLHGLLEEGLIADFSIWGNNRFSTSAPSAVVPLNSPRNRHHYDPETDLPKAVVDLPFACFQEIMAYVAVSEDVDISVLPEPFTNAELLLRPVK